jgi:hypothetical protein
LTLPHPAAICGFQEYFTLRTLCAMKRAPQGEGGAA